MTAATETSTARVRVAVLGRGGLQRFWAQPVLPLLIWWTLALAFLAQQSMWIDEWFTQERAVGGWAVLMADVIATERRPPLHFALVKFWVQLTGETEYAMRLLSIAAVLVSSALVYALGRRLLGKAAATWALWLLALSPFWLLYGRMIRAYSLTMALALLLTWLLLQALRRGGRWWLGYVVAGIALLYTDYSGLAVVAAHGMYGIVTMRSQGWRRVAGWLLAAALMGLAFVPWLTVVAAQVARDVRVTDLAGGPLGFALKLATPFFVWGAGESIYPWHPLGLAGAGAAGLLWLWGLVDAFRTRRDRFWLLLWSFAMPLLFTATLLTLIATDITFLNAAARSPAAAPFFYLAVANGIGAVQRRWLRRAAAAFIFIGFLAATVNYYRGEELLNPIYVVPARAVAAELAQSAGQGDLILAEPDTLIGHYYDLAPGAADYDDMTASHLPVPAEPNLPDAIYVITFGRDSTANSYATDELAAWLAQHYRLAEAQGYGPVAPLYRAVKERITGRPAYAYKLTVRKYVQP
jgi:4-amino-4-deoxy-L-arabinose transferase-like glycosyltransferase